MTLHVETIDDLEKFAALRTTWNDLLSRSPDDSLTLTSEWLTTWWRVYGAERDLRIITVFEDGRLIGAAPLLARRRAHVHHGLFRFKRYELLASGEGKGEAICSDYIGWIAETGKAEMVVGAILDHLDRAHGREWEEILLPDMDAASPTVASLLRACADRSLQVETRARDLAPYARLPSSFDAYLSTLGSSLRYQIRRGRRELEKGHGTYRVIDRVEEIPQAFATLVELHQSRWTGRGHAGAFASQRRRAFHEAIMPLALQAGWLRLGLLHADGQPVGAIYNFRYRGRVYFYQSGISPQSNSNLRPGLLLHSFEIEAAIAGGDQEYDFLKRGESDYKDQWTDAARELICLRVAKPLIKQHLLSAGRMAYSRLAEYRRRSGSESTGTPGS